MSVLNDLANRVPEPPEWGQPHFDSILARRNKALQDLRRYLQIRPQRCPGCYLGDDGVALHDLGYGCKYGKGAF